MELLFDDLVLEGTVREVLAHIFKNVSPSREAEHSIFGCRFSLLLGVVDLILDFGLAVRVGVLDLEAPLQSFLDGAEG